MAVWDDMLEGWAWGQEFQLGYYKHPPLYAWIVGLWFKVFPRVDASYYLLSAINIGAGLLGVWRVSGLLLGKYARLSTVSLLMFAPSYQYPATNFNANTILLSLWPWAAYFFVNPFRQTVGRTGPSSESFGGCALLSKYSSILFLASCFLAALLHPRRRDYFRSAAPYCAVLACGPRVRAARAVGLQLRLPDGRVCSWKEQPSAPGSTPIRPSAPDWSLLPSMCWQPRSCSRRWGGAGFPSCLAFGAS